MRRLSQLAVAALLAPAAATAAEPVRIGEVTLEPVAVEALEGFPGADPARTLAHLRAVCRNRDPAPAATVDERLKAAASLLCARADVVPDGAAARFFEEQVDAFRVVRPPETGTAEPRRTGFLTGYFEPELDASLERSPAYPVAVLARPADLVSLAPGETREGLDPSLRAARLVDGRLQAYPDRAAIEDGALGDGARPLLYLRDPVDLLVLQVQGSGRVRLPDGRSMRVLYDGKNGRPYTSIAKLIVGEGHLPLEGLTLSRWTSWLRAHPETARRLIRANASYVFFRLDDLANPQDGPLGGARTALVPGRSLAVDAAFWPYGLPFWLEARSSGAPAAATGRLVVAADTGSAILGAARGDLFVGTDEAAGAAAGDLRHAVGFVVLLPRPEADPKPEAASPQ